MSKLSSINILHASDLHISTQKHLRSPLDRLSDLENPWDLSGKGRREKMAILNNLAIAWWKKLAASSYDPEILESLAEFIYTNAKRKLGADGLSGEAEGLDAVILTGDLATTGTKDDIEKVAQFLKAGFDPKCPHRSNDKAYKGATLSAVEIPVIYLPGNHDRYTPTREFYRKRMPKFFNPGGRNFDQVLSDYRTNPIQTFDLVSDDERLRVTILTADFTLEAFEDHEGFYGWLAQGKVYSNLRRQLVKATYAAYERNQDDQHQCLLWAVHFPPGYPVKKSSNLLGETKLIQLANTAGVKAILSGHTHRQLAYRNPAMAFDGLCCGTTTQYEPMAGRHGLDPATGNLFEVITVTVNNTGNIEILPRHYKYSAGTPDNGPSLMTWSVVPS